MLKGRDEPRNDYMRALLLYPYFSPPLLLCIRSARVAANLELKSNDR